MARSAATQTVGTALIFPNRILPAIATRDYARVQTVKIAVLRGMSFGSASSTGNLPLGKLIFTQIHFRDNSSASHLPTQTPVPDTQNV